MAAPHALVSRILPPEEWPRLQGTEADPAWRVLDPDQARVLVVEEDEVGGEIVGCWIAMQILHAECVWIAPAHRKRAGVGRRLLSGMFHLARAAGARTLFTSAERKEVDVIIGKLGGQPVPGRMYAIPVPQPQPIPADEPVLTARGA